MKETIIPGSAMAKIHREEPAGRSIVLLSDSTGDLGERFLRAMITQFPDNSFTLKVFSFIKGTEELETLFTQIQQEHPIIFHTTQLAELKIHIESLSIHYGWPVYDLTDGAREFLQRVTGLRSVPRPEKLHELNQDYDKRVQSLEFTVDHDDGLRTQTLTAADIVLVGVSRTSKTPTSIYLAYKGYKVANVPLVKGLPLPEAVCDKRLRRVGLIINPDKLLEIRQSRADADRGPESDYTDFDAIREEIRWSRVVFQEWNIPVVDVTHHAVEETAALVLKALHLR